MRNKSEKNRENKSGMRKERRLNWIEIQEHLKEKLCTRSQQKFSFVLIFLLSLKKKEAKNTISFCMWMNEKIIKEKKKWKTKSKPFFLAVVYFIQKTKWDCGLEIYMQFKEEKIIILFL